MRKDQLQISGISNLCKQESVFVGSEADAWFTRNARSILEPAGSAHPVIEAIRAIELPTRGHLIDLGGAAGQVAAGVTSRYSGWQATILEPSAKAIKAGQAVFPKSTFVRGSLTQPKDIPAGQFDLVIVSFVMHWIDRTLLGQAIANIDRLVKPGGYLLISDFYTPYPRANSYHHHTGLFTYKQDYSLPFLALNLYTQIFLKVGQMSHTHSDVCDPYDAWQMTVVLRKDLDGRYRSP